MVPQKATCVKFAKTCLAAALALGAATTAADASPAKIEFSANAMVDGQVLSCERKGAQ